MRRLISGLLAMMLLCAFPAPAEEGQRAPDYLMEGFDDSTHDWETNLFFQRMQENTGIAFEFREHTDMERWKARKTEIAAGEDLPDVLFKAQLTPAETMEMAESGILIDLKPYLQEYAPALWALLQEKPDMLAAVTLPDGSIPALPAYNELPNNDLMWINTTWLNNVKMEVPTTADELTEVLRAFKTGDPNRNGKADEIPLAFIGMWELRFLGHAFGMADNDYYVHQDNGTVSTWLTTDNNRAFLTWLHQLWDENLIDHQGFSTVDSLRQITDSKAAIPYGVMFSNSPLSLIPATALSQYDLLSPLVWDGKQIYRDLFGQVTRGTFALTRNCREPEKMVAWVNTLYTHEGSLLLQVGREGEEYFWTEDGTWDWMADLETVANEVLASATLADGGVAPGIVETEFQTKYADAPTQRMIQLMAKGREFSVLPYPQVFLSREDRDRVTALQAAIAPYAEQQMAAFVTGDTEMNDGTWAEFVRGLQDRGLEEMVALWQKYVK